MPRYNAYKAAFETFSLLHLGGAIRRFSACRGVIFTLHRVLPTPAHSFSPNAILQVTPSFLDATIVKARAAGFDIVDLDEAVRRLASAAEERPFVVLTFDDAYRDNRDFALPILRHRKAPFTLYVPTALVDGTGEVWWQALEDIVSTSDEIVPAAGEAPRPAATLVEKNAVYDDLYWRYRRMPEPERVEALRALAERHGLDLAFHCRALVMDWNELDTVARDPLCTIGAHTVRHYELSKLPIEDARAEMARSRDILAERFGAAPRHFSYPLGGPQSAGEREFALAGEIGFRTAVTTRPGGLYPEHAARLLALPRISLNGLFQKERYLDTFLTGALFTALAGERVAKAT